MSACSASLAVVVPAAAVHIDLLPFARTTHAGAFLVGDWLVEPEISRIRKDDHEVHLEIRVMGVLVHLACHASRVVTRQRLIEAVWDGAFISDNTLTHAVAELRKALDDSAAEPEYIETIHRRGYRLLKTPGPTTPDRRRSWSARDRFWSAPSESNPRH